MKRYPVLFILCVVGLALFSWGSVSAEPLSVSIGLRSTYYQMTQNKGPIFGNIISLDENQHFGPSQNLIPFKPMIQLLLTRNWALELGYDQFSATTTNQGDDSHDGDIKWNPFMLALQYRFDLPYRAVVPYVFWGLSYNKVTFEERPWYRWGFPNPGSYDTWVGQGNRPEDYPNNAYRRKFTPKDGFGSFFGLGVDYFLSPNWALNMDWRYHIFKTNFRFLLGYDEGRDVTHDTTGSFNLEQWILGFGIKYFFN